MGIKNVRRIPLRDQPGNLTPYGCHNYLLRQTKN